MSKYDFESPKIDELRASFRRSKFSRKVGLDFDQVLAVIHPDSGEQLKDMVIDGLTSQQKRYLYRKYFAPAFTGCDTVRARQSYVNKENSLKLLSRYDLSSLPTRLREVSKRLINSGMEVHLPENQSTKLVVNGKLCGVYKRSTIIYYHNRPYIQFVIKQCVLEKLDFVIVYWEDHTSSKAYVIPAHLLKSDGEEIQVYNIPLNKLFPRGRKAILNWEEYDSNWNLLKAAA